MKQINKNEEEHKNEENIDFTFSENELFYAEKASKEAKELILNRKIKPLRRRNKRHVF